MVTIILKKDFPLTKKKLIKRFLQSKIQTRSMWLPIHLQKQYKKFEKFKMSHSLHLFNNSINIPCSTNLSKKDTNKIINFLKKI